MINSFDFAIFLAAFVSIELYLLKNIGSIDTKLGEVQLNALAPGRSVDGD